MIFYEYLYYIDYVVWNHCWDGNRGQKVMSVGTVMLAAGGLNTINFPTNLVWLSVVVTATLTVPEVPNSVLPHLPAYSRRHGSPAEERPWWGAPPWAGSGRTPPRRGTTWCCTGTLLPGRSCRPVAPSRHSVPPPAPPGAAPSNCSHLLQNHQELLIWNSHRSTLCTIPCSLYHMKVQCLTWRERVLDM